MTGRQAEAGPAIARGAAAGWLQVMVAFLVAPLYTAIVLAKLPREDAGFWMVILSLGAYFNLFDLGLGPTLTRYVAFARQAGPRTGAAPLAGEAAVSAADLYATARRLYAVLAAALVAVGLAAGPPLLSHATGLALAGTHLVAWVLFLAGSAASVLATPYQAAVAGSGVVGVPRMMRAGAQIAGVAAAAVALVIGQGIVGAAAAWAAQQLALLAAGPLVVRSYCPEILRGGRYQPAVARLLARPSLQLAGIHLGGALILASGPLIVAAQAGPSAVPQFVVVRQLAEAMYLLALVPAQVSEPFISRDAAAGDVSGVTALLRRNVRYVGAVLAVGAPVVAVLGREVITAWVGAANFAGYAALWLMVALYVLEAHHVLHAATIMATGRVVFLVPALLSGVATIGLGIALGHRWGVAGVVAGMFAAQLLTNNWYAPWYALRQLALRTGEYARWLSPLVPLAAVTAVLAAATRQVVRSVGPVTPATVLCALVALGAAVLPLLWYAALTTDERRAVGRAWRRAEVES